MPVKQVYQEPEENAMAYLADLKSDDKLKNLLDEINVQQATVNQASKALFWCHRLRGFETGEERVESEKALLKATLQLKALMNEIKLMKNLKEGENKDPESDETGEIVLSKFKLLVTDNFPQVKKRDEQRVEWFIVVVIHKLFTWVSEAVQGSIHNNEILINQKVKIDNIYPSFDISVQVYSLKLDQISFMNHDEKFRIRNDSEQVWYFPCPKLLQFIQKLRKSHSKSRDHSCLGTSSQSAFKLIGTVHVNRGDYLKTGPRVMTCVCLCLIIFYILKNGTLLQF